MIQTGKQLLKQIENAGFEAYLVGGCVRDLILQRPIHDVDICTSAHPADVMKLFERVIPTGLKHGTVTVIYEHIAFEVTTYRSDGSYDDHRHPSHIHYTSSLKEDLERRDFTMNALAMDRHERVYDMFDGQKDLQNQCIRTVGNPQERFQEDALRMLRAIRFSAQLAFHIDPKALLAIQTCVGLLAHISRERITSEFEDVMASSHVQHGLAYMLKSHIADQVYPFTEIKTGIRQCLTFPLQHLNCLERWVFMLSFATAEQREAFLSVLRLKKIFSKQINTLSRNMIEYAHIQYVIDLTDVQLFDLGIETVTSIIKINKLKTTGHIPTDVHIAAQNAFKRLPIQHDDQLSVSGKDILTWTNLSPGPWIQRVLETTKKAVIQGHVDNEKEKIKTYLIESGELHE